MVCGPSGHSQQDPILPPRFRLSLLVLATVLLASCSATEVASTSTTTTSTVPTTTTVPPTTTSTIAPVTIEGAPPELTAAVETF